MVVVSLRSEVGNIYSYLYLLDFNFQAQDIKIQDDGQD